MKSVSVAVLVDGTYKKEKDKNVYIPRPDADLKKYADVVRAAIGFNKDRGDQVIVENVPFETAVEEMPKEKTDFLQIGVSLLKYIVPLIGVLLVLLLVIKPLIEMMKAIKPLPVLTLPTEMAATVHTPTAPQVTEEQIMKEEVLGIVKQDPRRAAGIVKEWLSE